MSDASRGAARSVESRDGARRQLEGGERVRLLRTADFLAVTVAGSPDGPSVVFIGWSATLLEQAYPGTAIWRAALERFLRTPPTNDPAAALVRRSAAESLARFESLESWLAWCAHEREHEVPRSRAGARPREFWISAP